MFTTCMHEKNTIKINAPCIFMSMTLMEWISMIRLVYFSPLFTKFQKLKIIRQPSFALARPWAPIEGKATIKQQPNEGWTCFYYKQYWRTKIISLE